MSSEWPKVKLADYCDKIGSGATPRGGSNVYLDSGEISLVRSQNVYNHGFDYDGLVYIDEEAAEKLSNVELEENDVLINITGDSVARVCMVPDDVLPARVNQHVSILRPKEDLLDPRFLRYSLVNHENQYKLLAIASAGGTRKAITKGHLEEFEISLPDLAYQKEVSKILSTFDQKIHLNQQTNETLEAMAQAIFKSWFVDFDPVRQNRSQVCRPRPEPCSDGGYCGISLDQTGTRLKLLSIKTRPHVRGPAPATPPHRRTFPG
jgi:type I restriction enzyme, S subunit